MLFKKISSIFVSCVLVSVLAIGCSDVEMKEYDNNQTQQEQTIEQPQVQDEDLNQEYKQEVSQNEQLKQAKSLIEKIAVDSLTDFRWDVYIDEDSNTVILRVHATATDCAVGLQDGSYATLTNAMTENSKVGKEVLEQLGLDVNYSVMLMDLDTEMVYFASVNGEVLYDASK